MKNEEPRRWLVTLGVASTLLFFGLACAPAGAAGGAMLWQTILTGVSSVAAGNVANAIDALRDWLIDRDRYSSENEHLTKAVGRAIGAVIDLAAEEQQWEVRHNLTKIADRARDKWVEIYRGELAEERYPELTEGKIEELLTSEELDLAQTGNLAAEGWKDIFARLNMNARKGQGGVFKRIPPEVYQRVGVLLHEKFPEKLIEILKEDFANDGTVFAPLMLRLVVDIKAELQNIGTNYPQVLDHFQRLEIQLGGTAAQQQELFEQISQQMDYRFAEVLQGLGGLEGKITDLQDRLMPKSVTLEQWRNICRQNLVAQRKLTTSDFHNAGGMDLDKNYVPLAIVERKSGKPQGMGRSKQREEEKLTPIAEDSFFEEVLLQGQSEKSQGRRIAIIGEPGSGKTTRLQKIAFWILEKKLGLPIWVSLADLKNEQSIPDYIKNVWLEKAGKDIAIDALTEHEEQIWLLLDGLDEMTPRIERHHVEQLLTGWVDKARAIVTCRVNVWDADKNAFSGFDIFKNLPFEREQIEQFIRRWFGEEGDSLIQALQEPGRERLLDLVRNPLRLTLLCHTWQYGSSLPDTQAQLYDDYLKEVYEWNKNSKQLNAQAERCQTNITDLQDRLTRKLGELAKAALDMPEEGFRLSQRLVEKYLGKKNDDKSLCHLALGLGWLNRLGKDSRRKDIFIFYHATFQEYFAALAVDDWDYFLPKQHRNFPVPGKEYRIFSPQWRQVILLWLGRDSGVADEDKESLIEALLNFDDGCGDWHYDKVDRGFYEYRAYFLAAAGISEFKNCLLADRIVDRVVKWSFGYFNEEKQEWVKYPDRIGNAAREVLPQTDRDRAIRELSQLLKSPHSSGYTRMQAAYILDEIDPDKKEAIAALLELIKTTDNKYIRSDAVETLGETGQGNKEAIAALLELIKTTEDQYIRSVAAESLGKIDPGNKEAIAALLELIKTAEDEDIFFEAAQVLGEIGQGNKEAIDTLVELIKTTKNEMERSLAAYSLGQIEQGNKEAIAALLEIVKTTEDENIRWLGALILGEIEPDNKEAIAASFQVIKTTENENIRSFSIVSLGQIGQGNKEAIAILVELVKTAENQNIRRLAAETLAEIGQGNKEAIAALVQLIEATENEETRWRAAESLGEINPGNKKDITALVQLIEDIKNEETRWLAAESLGKIDPGNKKAIAALVELITTTDNEDIRRQTAWSLGKIDPGNKEAIAALVELLKTTDNENIRGQAAWGLEEAIATAEQQGDVVSALRAQLGNETYENNFDLFEECYGILWNIAQDLPYPEFYSAWHGLKENKISPINLE